MLEKEEIITPDLKFCHHVKVKWSKEEQERIQKERQIQREIEEQLANEGEKIHHKRLQYLYDIIILGTFKQRLCNQLIEVA